MSFNVYMGPGVITEWLRCPSCGHLDEVNAFDCGGSCYCNVFCIICHAEIDPETGKVHKCKKGDKECERVAASMGYELGEPTQKGLF